jgi:long-chain acyl-CoA synthetase
MVVVGANRPRLYATMLAAQSLGAIPVPLYQDAVAAECVFPINNADVRFCLVEDQEQVDKMLEIRDRCPQLEHLLRRPARPAQLHEDGLAALDELIGAGKRFARKNPGFLQGRGRQGPARPMWPRCSSPRAPRATPRAWCTPTARCSTAPGGRRVRQADPNEEVLAYLPPAWIGQNIFSYAQWLACGYVVNCPESAATVTIDLKEVGPTYYFAPPRVFEGLLTSVMIRMEDAGALKRKMFHAFMDVARRVGPARWTASRGVSATP